MTEGQELLVALAKQFGLQDFVETGTSYGGTFRAVEGYFKRAFTIEFHGVKPELAAIYSFSDIVHLFAGVSGDRLAEILQRYAVTRALFWLDAHTNVTPVDDGQNQVPKELAAIAQFAPDSLVVIDDITFENGRYRVNSSYDFEI